MSVLSWMKKGPSEADLISDDESPNKNDENKPLLENKSRSQRKRKVSQPFGDVTDSGNISCSEDEHTIDNDEKPNKCSEPELRFSDDEEVKSKSPVISDNDDEDESYVAPNAGKRLIDSDDSDDEPKKKKTAAKGVRGGRGGLTPRYGRGRGRGGGGGSRGGRASGGPNEFNTEASKKKFYKKLSGLDKPALISMVRAMIEGGEVTMAAVNNRISSNIDLTSQIAALEKAKDAIFKAMPKPWKYGCSATYSRNNFAKKRCGSSSSAFKTLLRAQVADLKNLDDPDTKVEYVINAWPVVKELPQWIGCGGAESSKELLMCCDILATMLAQAIPKVGKEKLEEISGNVEEMVSFRGEMGVEVESEKMKNNFELIISKI